MSVPAVEGDSSSGPADFASLLAATQDPQTQTETPATEQITETPATSERPAYWPQLERVPEGMRPLVEPIFKEWDSGVNQRFQKIREEEYGWVKPYEGLKDVDPDFVRSALQYASAVQENPVAVYEAMQRALSEQGAIETGQTQTQQQQTPTAPVIDESLWEEIDPRLKSVFDTQAAQMKQQGELITLLSQNYLSDQEKTGYAEAEAEIDRELAEAKATAPLWDDEYVISQMNLTGCTAKEAAARLQERFGEKFVPKGQTITQTPVAAPTVMGASGSIPTTQIEMGKLSDQQRRALLAASLQAASQQS